MGPHHTTRGTYGTKMVVEGMDVTSLKHDKKKGHLILDTSNIRMSFYLDKTSFDWNPNVIAAMCFCHILCEIKKEVSMASWSSWSCPDQETQKF